MALTADRAYTQPHVVAVVLNWNARDETLTCLQSLASSAWARLTVVMVDNGSDEELGPVVTSRFPQTIVVRNADNLGFSGGMNTGIRRGLELGADYLLLLNNDTLVDREMVARLVETAARFPDAGIVCPLVLYRDRPDTILSAGLRCDLRRGYQGRPIAQGERDHGQFATVRELDAPAGAAMLVPARLVGSVGMLDEELFLYGEDVEWATRMRLAGHRVLLAPNARLWHGLSTSSGGANSPLSAYYLTRNSFDVSARYAPLRGARDLFRTVEILLANLMHARRSRHPLQNLRAVLAGWSDYRRGRRGACPRGLAWTPSPAPGPATPEIPRVAVSAGFSKTHVTTAASEALRRGQLSVLITGAYPTTRVAGVLRQAARGRLARLAARGEQIPGEYVRPIALPELLCELSLAAGRLTGKRRLAERVCVLSFRLYGRWAGRLLDRAPGPSSVYHFRAGFGQESLAVARRRGMHLLCDHAIAHPATLEALIGSRGRSMEPARGNGAAPSSPLERCILADIEQADSVLVNSEFVRQTFLARGWSPERLHVVYLGVDDNFMARVPDPALRPPGDGSLRLLFAGRLEARKGADVLVEALSRLPESAWELVVAGPVDPEVRRRHAGFLERRQVKLLGAVGRAELARQMAEAPVFVFPSYAEGSARVVFEALACGCYVITTHNSGTIVQHGVHGAIVAAGDARQTSQAIAAAAADPERVAEIGRENAALIRSRYRQHDYGEALAEVYRAIAGHGRAAS